MHVVLTYIAGGLVAVTLIDTVGCVAAKRRGFSYARLAPLSRAVYFGTGVAVGLLVTPGAALLAGLAVGAFDSTVGWAISWWIGPGRLPDAHVRWARLAGISFSVTVLAGFIALAGGLAASLIAGTT